MSDIRNHETSANVFAMVVGTLLDPNQGMIIHFEGQGYFVFLSYNDEDQEYDIMIKEDAELLLVPSFTLVALSDEDIEPETPSYTLQ